MKMRHVTAVLLALCVAAQAAALLADTPDEAAVQTTDAEQEGTGDESDL